MFPLTLTAIAKNYFKLIINSIQDIASVREKFLKRFNSLGQFHREQCTNWHNMKFDHTKHEVEQFAYGLKVLGKILGM